MCTTGDTLYAVSRSLLFYFLNVSTSCNFIFISIYFFFYFFLLFRLLRCRCRRSCYELLRIGTHHTLTHTQVQYTYMHHVFMPLSLPLNAGNEDLYEFSMHSRAHQCAGRSRCMLCCVCVGCRFDSKTVCAVCMRAFSDPQRPHCTIRIRR